MINLKAARDAAFEGSEKDTLLVSRRWLAQVCLEIEKGREALKYREENIYPLLDHEPVNS